MQWKWGFLYNIRKHPFGLPATVPLTLDVWSDIVLTLLVPRR